MADQPDEDQNQAISDDQELAKVLAGVNQQAEEVAQVDDGTGLPALPQPTTEDDESAETTENEEEVSQPSESEDTPAMPTPAEPMPPAPAPLPEAVAPASQAGDPALDSIKQQALGELRPLVDKLNVGSDEKFDTYLLLLRSTDDKDLIGPAYEAARGITDEARRAQALLDVIKEIDFLNQN